MTITKRLLNLDPSLQLHNEGAWQSPFDDTKTGFSSFNDAGVESEVGEFLYSSVRIVKPKHVLETGTHWGIGASYMGMGLKDNKEGHLDTIEFLPEIHKVARERIEKLGLTKEVTCHFGDVAYFEPKVKYQMIFLDTEPQTRFAELLRFYPHLEQGGYIFIHDLHRHMHQIENKDHGFAWPFGVVPDEMRALVTQGKLRVFHFQTPRGMTGFYKVSDEDYKW